MSSRISGHKERADARNTLVTFRKKKSVPLKLIKSHMNVGFEVFTAVTMKIAVFLDVAPCRSCVNRRFGGIYRSIFRVEKSASEEQT
jgi:hypothetical protein